MNITVFLFRMPFAIVLSLAAANIDNRPFAGSAEPSLTSDPYEFLRPKLPVRFLIRLAKEEELELLSLSKISPPLLVD
jgi:hypothetical protein